MEAHRGHSLHIGLNGVDPSHYQGWDGALVACEADANDMEAIAKSRGFQTKKLLTRAATSDAVIKAIGEAANDLTPGDIFLLSYSGHGGQVPDTNSDEPDEQDETWVLYDRQLIDDELYALWARFANGVRILVFSDSCHSGSAVRGAFYAASPANEDRNVRFKLLPRDIQDKTYRANKQTYDDIQKANRQGDAAGVGASVLLFSGCQDNQFSRDGDRNGLFTQRLREVWNDGKFQGRYRGFYRKIADLMPPDQSPNYFRTGLIDPSFERRHPFSI
jgi:hypothetical protein